MESNIKNMDRDSLAGIIADILNKQIGSPPPNQKVRKCFIYFIITSNNYVMLTSPLTMGTNLSESYTYDKHNSQLSTNTLRPSIPLILSWVVHN